MPVASAEADLDALINQMIGSGHEALAVQQNGVVLGVITQRDLLRGVQGTPNAHQADAPGTVLESTP